MEAPLVLLGMGKPNGDYVGVGTAGPIPKVRMNAEVGGSEITVESEIPRGEKLESVGWHYHFPAFTAQVAT
jgi:hypothetical protein